jgi:hypothetical protein
LKKLSLLLLFYFLLFSFVSAQTLVELAKKEKERREKIQRKEIVVITNTDLIKMKKKPALANPLPALTQQEVTETVRQILSTEGPALDLPNTIDSEASTSEESPSVEELEEAWNTAEETASLLALQLRALLQEFYSQDDKSAKEDILRQMNETSLELEQAQKEAEAAKQNLDLARAKLKRKRSSTGSK